jgi:hypothetical protein
MQKWSYVGLNIGANGIVTGGQYQGAGFGQAANTLGTEGWELVLGFPLGNGTQEFIFKRPA